MTAFLRQNDNSPVFIAKRPKGTPPNDTQASKQSEILSQTGIMAGQPTPPNVPPSEIRC